MSDSVHIFWIPVKEKFVSQVTKMIERKNENSEKVKSGWFTPDQMRNELKWTAFLVRNNCRVTAGSIRTRDVCKLLTHYTCSLQLQ